MKTLLFLCLILTAVAQQLPTVSTRSIILSVTATGTNLQYQWYRNGAKITGQTAATLTITDATATGTYTCVVFNSAGRVTSPAVKLANTTQASAPSVTVTRKSP